MGSLEVGVCGEDAGGSGLGEGEGSVLFDAATGLGGVSGCAGGGGRTPETRAKPSVVLDAMVGGMV